jgi:hypothetical protein
MTQTYIAVCNKKFEFEDALKFSLKRLGKNVDDFKVPDYFISGIDFEYKNELLEILDKYDVGIQMYIYDDNYDTSIEGEYRLKQMHYRGHNKTHKFENFIFYPERKQRITLLYKLYTTRTQGGGYIYHNDYWIVLSDLPIDISKSKFLHFYSNKLEKYFLEKSREKIPEITNLSVDLINPQIFDLEIYFINTCDIIKSPRYKFEIKDEMEKVISYFNNMILENSIGTADNIIVISSIFEILTNRKILIN